MHGAGNYSEDTSGAHLEYLQLLWRCDCYRTLLMSGCQVTHGNGLTSPLSRQSEIIRGDQYLMQRLLPFGFNYN